MARTGSLFMTMTGMVHTTSIWTARSTGVILIARSSSVTPASLEALSTLLLELGGGNRLDALLGDDLVDRVVDGDP